MFGDGESNGIIWVVGLIVTLMIGIVIICSVVIPIVIDSSYEPALNFNGDGMGMPLEKSTTDRLNTSMEFTADSEGVHITGDYVGDREYADQILLISDKVVIYIQGGQLWYFNSALNSTDPVTSLSVLVSNGMVNNVSYEWLYYPNEEGPYRSYTPPLDYKLSDVVTFGLYNSNGIISNGEDITANTTPLDFTVEIKEQDYGIKQVYYTWSD